MSRLALVVAATLTVLVLAGCGTGDSAESAGEAAEHVATYEAEGEGGDGALLEGTVQVLDGCLLVSAAGQRFLPYFPDDEIGWSDDRLSYGGEAFGEGDAISLGGGEGAIQGQVPQACEALSGLTRWVVAQSD